MADKTQLNVGVNGDVFMTEDIGAYKLPATKIYVGAHGVDGGPVTPANPLPVIPGTGAQWVTVPVRGPLINRSGTITVGGAAQALAVANTTRNYLLVVNPASNTASLWVDFGVDAVAASPSIEIRPGGALVFEASFIPTDAVSILAATTATPFIAREG